MPIIMHYVHMSLKMIISDGNVYSDSTVNEHNLGIWQSSYSVTNTIVSSTAYEIWLISVYCM